MKDSSKRHHLQGELLTFYQFALIRDIMGVEKFKNSRTASAPCTSLPQEFVNWRLISILSKVSVFLKSHLERIKNEK